jgi:hypothetical protein
LFRKMVKAFHVAFYRTKVKVSTLKHISATTPFCPMVSCLM